MGFIAECSFNGLRAGDLHGFIEEFNSSALPAELI